MALASVRPRTPSGEVLTNASASAPKALKAVAEGAAGGEDDMIDAPVGSQPSPSITAPKKGGRSNKKNKDDKVATEKRYKNGILPPAEAATHFNPASKAGLMQLLKLMAKINLQLMAAKREHEGVLYDNIRLSTDSPHTVAMKAWGRSFAEKAAATREPIGPPHVFKFFGLIESLAKTELEETAPQQMKNAQEAVKNFHAEMERLPEDRVVDTLAETARMCKTTQLYQKDFTMLTLAVERTPIRKEILCILLGAGGILKTGRAPPGAMEQQLASWLDAALAEK